MIKGIVLMTAMPFTKGHENLIRFAANYLGFTDELNIIMSFRSHEPFMYERFMSMSMFVSSELKNTPVSRYSHDDDNAPQNPSESISEEVFWQYWKQIIVNKVGEIKNDDVVFASDSYGIKLAEVLGCQFIPYNQYRQTAEISGTEIRSNVLKNFNKISTHFQPALRQTITFFGAESCGKSTLSRALSYKMNGVLVPEWAREYLETVGPEVTAEKMRNIVKGQLASQKTAISFAADKPFIFQDTDLLSTFGYYKLWNNKNVPKDDILECEYQFASSQSDFYILMNDKIPFEPDPLRYGGNIRESDNVYWKNLLNQYDLPYYEIQSYTKRDQFFEAQEVITNLFYDSPDIQDLINFRRT